jgi:hypothetical protein
MARLRLTPPKQLNVGVGYGLRAVSHTDGYGPEWYGWLARRGWARYGSVWLARHGKVRWGAVWLGRARLVGCGGARCGTARLGAVR